MKTFVSDDFQVTLEDNGGITIRRTVNYVYPITITYNPNEIKYRWVMKEGSGKDLSITASQHISGLGLLKAGLLELHKALELVGKQDLMDKEIVFVDK